MSPRLVFRTEHRENRKGPWTTGPGAADASGSLPCYIPNLANGRCAMNSKREFYLHFTASDRQLLRLHNFVLTTYMVPPGPLNVDIPDDQTDLIDHYRGQVGFNAETAIRVEEEEL